MQIVKGAPLFASLYRNGRRCGKDLFSGGVSSLFWLLIVGIMCYEIMNIMIDVLNKII